MMLIDGDALSKTLSVLADNMDRSGQIVCEQIQSILGCYEVEQLWTPVTEGLPKNDDWVIVTIKDESADRPYIYSDFGWYLDAAKCWIVDADQRRDIIAWRKLPAPWKGEDDSDGKLRRLCHLARAE